MKTAFLHNMTNQMIEPAEAIDRNVSALCSLSTEAGGEMMLADEIQKSGTTIAELLDNLINVSDEEKRKEANND